MEVTYGRLQHRFFGDRTAGQLRSYDIWPRVEGIETLERDSSNKKHTSTICRRYSVPTVDNARYCLHDGQDVPHVALPEPTNAGLNTYQV